MTPTIRLMRRRRFAPLMATQFFNAFNDNLYKTALVLFVVYSVYNDERQEALFSAMATGIFIFPFVAFSALAGQLADTRDKSRIIRIVKLCEIGWASLGVAGLFMAWQGIAVHSVAIPLLLLVVFFAALQSTFFGPIKYAILPQHLHKDEVLPGTGLVEAGTYVAILTGTILAGFLPIEASMVLIMLVAVTGYLTCRLVPPAPPQSDYVMHFPLLEPYAARPGNRLLHWLGYIPVAIADQAVMGWRLTKEAMHQREIQYAILAISFFWTIGAVLFIQFPPLAKNQLMASREVASIFLVVFSVGIAIGSIGVNSLLRGVVSARYSPVSVIVMGLFVIGFYLVAKAWPNSPNGELLSAGEFMLQPLAWPMLAMLLGISTAGGFFVVPLYAFLTTRCAHDAASRTIAANNIVNSLAMVIGSLAAMGLTVLGVPIVEQVLLCAAMCLISAHLGRRLFNAELEAHRAASAEPV